MGNRSCAVLCRIGNQPIRARAAGNSRSWWVSNRQRRAPSLRPRLSTLLDQLVKLCCETFLEHRIVLCVHLLSLLLDLAVKLKKLFIHNGCGGGCSGLGRQRGSGWLCDGHS